MKKKALFLLLILVLPVSYSQADNKSFPHYLQQLPTIIPNIIYPIPIKLSHETGQKNAVKLFKIQSSVDKIKSDMRYFVTKDTLKKNGLRPIIKRRSIAIHYTYRW